MCFFCFSFEEITTTSSSIIDETEEMTAQPNTALLSTILMFGTFFIGYFLKEFRNSVFLGEKVRENKFEILYQKNVLFKILINVSKFF
jgi:hypothetical protein